MKRFSLFLALTTLLLCGCSQDKVSVLGTAAEKASVAVRFELTSVSTETSVVPMTRATTYTNWISNHGRALLLKKADGRWIVERTDTVFLDGKPSRWSSIMRLTADRLPAASFGFELRPGDYRIVVVLNPESSVWNKALVPGTVVADENNPALRTPPLISYLIVGEGFMNKGYRMLNREVFVATADFTVPKSGDLHSAGMPAIPLKAERRVGKVRMLVKDKPSPIKGFTFMPTPHFFRMIFTALDQPFAEGIDALGGMYYSEEGLYQLPWFMSTMGFHTSGSSLYQLCQTNSTAFSPFLFIGPEAGDMPFEITVNTISGASDGFTYLTDQVFTRTLAASRTTGIVFQTTDVSEMDDSPYLVHVEEATDDQGNKERAEKLFDAFYEWNAEFDY